jgi:hypothetical protein
VKGPHVIPASAEHVALLAPRVREADRLELWASGRITPERALAIGVDASTSAWTGFVDDEVVCMFGVVPASLVGGIGVPWMIGSDAIVRHQRAFLRRCRGHLERMQVLYDTLVNFVDDRNVVAHRWLTWLGFHVEPPQPYGPDGLLFRRFTWRRPHV